MQSVTQLRRVGGEGRKHSRRERGGQKEDDEKREEDRYTGSQRKLYLSLVSTLSTVYMQQYKRQYTHR